MLQQWWVPRFTASTTGTPFILTKSLGVRMENDFGGL